MNKATNLARWAFKLTDSKLKGKNLTYDFDSMVIYYLVLRLNPTRPLNDYFTKGYNALTKFYGFNIDDPIYEYLASPDLAMADFELKEEIYGSQLIDFKNTFFKIIAPKKERMLYFDTLCKMKALIYTKGLYNSYQLLRDGFQCIYRHHHQTISSQQLKINYGFDDHAFEACSLFDKSKKLSEKQKIYIDQYLGVPIKMAYEHTYVFKDWSSWSDTLFYSAIAFYAYYGVQPQHCFLSPHTLSQMQYITELKDKRENHYQANSNKSMLYNFKKAPFDIDFYIHPHLTDRYFILYYADIDNGGDQPVDGIILGPTFSDILDKFL